MQREQQARIVARFVRSIIDRDAAARVIVMGDLNDFEFSSSLAVLKAGGLVNLTETLPMLERYTYVFDGNGQALDHILVTRPLAAAARYDIVHVNAEFADRLSDHDPVIARFAMRRRAREARIN